MSKEIKLTEDQLEKLVELAKKGEISIENLRSIATQIAEIYGQRMVDTGKVPFWLRSHPTVDFAEYESQSLIDNAEKIYGTYMAPEDFPPRWEWEVIRYFQSSAYRVSFYIMPEKGYGKMGYIAFRRRDGEAIDSWREKQLIKDVICGTHTEAVELFPSWLRMMDNCNQYHLWFRPYGSQFPLGIDNCSYNMSTESDGIGEYVNQTHGVDAKQKQRKPEHVYNPDSFPRFGLLGQWWMPPLTLVENKDQEGECD